MNVLLAIFLGGGLGSIARFGFGRLAARFYEGPFPLGTFVANVLACVVMAFGIAYFASKDNMSEAYKSFLLVGFCGGFSTFSTFSMETLELMKQGAYGWVVANVLLSVGVCIGLLYIISRIPST